MCHPSASGPGSRRGGACRRARRITGRGAAPTEDAGTEEGSVASGSGCTPCAARLASSTSLKEDGEAPPSDLPVGGVSQDHRSSLLRPGGPPGEGVADAEERIGTVAAGVGVITGGGLVKGVAAGVGKHTGGGLVEGEGAPAREGGEVGAGG